MDLDNINDIEDLREIAKRDRAHLLKDIVSDSGNYTFKEGWWYLVDQDDCYVYIHSEDYVYTKSFTYKEASKYLW